jgi:hypothetical protein
MRRIYDRQPSTLFRGGELARLLTMIVMLGVIAMLMGRARDPRTWRMFLEDEKEKPRGQYTLAQVDAEEERERERSAERGARSAEQTQTQQQTEAQQPEAEKTDAGESAAEPADATPEKPSETKPTQTDEPAAGEAPAPAENPQPEYKPTDEDPDEQDAIKEELTAVTDKTPLAAEEMFAYQRMLKWSMNETAAQMRKRAKKNIRFGELFQHPDKYRGKLLDIDVHIRQAVVDNDLPKNELGLKRTFEVWGWNANSQPYSYVLVCAEVPRDMPLGERLTEEGRFEGYFLKLMAYEDHEGKHRSAPLLIGRLIWDPSPSAKTKIDAADNSQWWYWALAGGLLVLFAARWGTRLLAAPKPTRSSLPRARGGDTPEEIVPLETWLDRAEADENPAEAIKRDAEGEEDTKR